MKNNFGAADFRKLVLASSVLLTFILFSQGIFAIPSTWTVAPSPAVPTHLASSSCASPSENTISAAITTASSGDTINVCSGTYVENITISKSLTVVGAGALTTTIKAPGTIVPDSNGLTNIVIINGTGVYVDFSGFNVSGPGPSSCGSVTTGIFVRDNANAYIHDNSIAHIRDDPLSGCQNGIGILVGRKYFPFPTLINQVGNATIKNNFIFDYQKGGIVVDNTGSFGNIMNNVITGAGPTFLIAANGIQVSRGAAASLNNNTVTGNEYFVDSSHHGDCNPIPSNFNNLTEVYQDCSTATGVLFFGADNSSTATGNNVNNNDIDFYTDTNTSIHFNLIFANRFFGIDALDFGGTLNAINNDYHTCFPIQSAFAVADISPNVIYVPFISHGCLAGSQKLTAYAVKKDIQICNSGTSTPQGPSPEIGGCVDLLPDEGHDPTFGNQTYVRSGSYLFSGELLAEIVVAQDLDGAQFLDPVAYLQVNSTSKVICTDVTSLGYQTGNLWFGHSLQNLFATLPPGGFNPTFDKIYQCLYTITLFDNGLSAISVLVGDIEQTTASTLNQYWYLNPGISASVTFNSVNQSLIFPTGAAGTTVYSTNSLLIKNTALGGVDLAVFITGNNLMDTSGLALCPTTNVLSINNIGYRCNIGSYFSEQWTPIPNVKQSADCGDTGVLPEVVNSTDPKCLADPSWNHSNILIPDPHAHVSDSILHNGAQAQCTFQLNVPFPCMGTFSATNALDVLIRAV